MRSLKTGLSIKTLSVLVMQTLIDIRFHKQKCIVLSISWCLYGCLEMPTMSSRSQSLFQSLTTAHSRSPLHYEATSPRLGVGLQLQLKQWAILLKVLLSCLVNSKVKPTDY